MAMAKHSAAKRLRSRYRSTDIHLSPGWLSNREILFNVPFRHSLRSSCLKLQEHLLCVASSTDWQRAGVPGETVTSMIVKGLVVRGAVGQLELTTRGRITAQAMVGTLWD